MCYLCRKPVTDYKHFYGQGGAPGGQATCPLWSDNKSLHENDVAKGALAAVVAPAVDRGFAALRSRVERCEEEALHQWVDNGFSFRRARAGL